MNKFDIVTNEKYLIGESPIWDYENNILIWADLITGCIYEYDAKTGTVNMIVNNIDVNGFAINKTGFIIASRKGIYLYDRKEKPKLLSDRFEGQSLICNDSIADSKGRFLFGTIYYIDKNSGSDYPLGKLYKVESDGRLGIMDEGFHHVNGLGFSPDNKTLYFTDTVLRTIYAYDYDQAVGAVKNRRIFVKVPDNDGIPDGLTVDADGYVWSAQWYGGCIVRYDPDGYKERRIKLPVKQVSSLAFGGEDLKDIYITTAGKSIRLSVAPEGYDFSSKNVGGYVYRFNSDIEGKKEFKANITI